MRKILSGNFFFIVIYLFLAFLTFGKLRYNFFQQDEWAIIGTFLYFDKANLSWPELLFNYGQTTHTIPLSGILSYYEYKFFDLNFSSYAYFSVGMHLLNVFLVFYLAYLFFKKKLLAFIAGLIFLVDAIPSQSITWTATTSSTAGSALFTLLSLVFLTRYLLHKNKKIFIALSFIFIFLSLGFKESSIFMLLFIPVYWFIFERTKNYKKALYTLFPVFLIGGIYTFSRLFLIFINSSSPSVSDGLSNPTLAVYFYRIIVFPIKSISQSIIPGNFINFFSDKLVSVGYPHFVQGGIPNPMVSQSIGGDMISYIFSLIILCVCVFFYKKAISNKMFYEAKLIIASLLFIALSSLPLIFIPGGSAYFSLFDGRYLYLTGVFKSILLTNILFLVYVTWKKKTIPFLIFFLPFFIGFNVLTLQRSLENEMKQGNTRRLILNQIQKDYSKLPEKVIFYAESDSSYYGLPLDEKILPFLSGFGQTLLVWYNGHGENFPGCFFKDKYLYSITSEEYKECDGRGFGYFRNFKSLKEATDKYKIEPENIIGFRYVSDKNKLFDITSEIRKKVQ